MNRSEHYERAKGVARDLRQRYGFGTPKVTRSDLRRIYKDEGIRIDLWEPRLKKLRGAYFRDDGAGPSVMLAKGLPVDPMVFTMAHELKHHFMDADRVAAYCDASNESEVVEIGAEVFAAELIFPEADCLAEFNRHLVNGACTAETIVRLKRESQTTLSYAGLVKRAERFGLAEPGAFKKISWKILEERIYGEPLYKRLHRRRRS